MAKVQEKKLQKTAVTVSPQDLGVELPPLKPGARTAFALWVRALLQNWRQGTVASRGRSDVARSTKKPWKQKGTGRARAGSARSPLWRGGGVTFGPQARTKTLKVTKNNKRIVCEALLNKYLGGQKVFSLDWSPEDKPRTADALAALKTLGVEEKKLLVFLPREDFVAYASMRNLPKVRIVFYDQLNAYDLAKSEYWVFLKKDLDSFKKMVGQWLSQTN